MTKGTCPNNGRGSPQQGLQPKTSYKDPLPPKSRTGRPSGNLSYLGKYMYLLNVGRVEINCMDCNIFYGMHVKGVKGITL